ncbi:hypothetical protein ACWDG1_50305, partial [Streptomyces sp. NPDC001177]
MSLSQIADSTQGRMVGNHLSTSVIGGKAVSVFAVGRTPANGQAFDEALYTAGPLAVTGGSAASRTRGGATVPAPHIPKPLPIRLISLRSTPRCVPVSAGAHLVRVGGEFGCD